MTYIVYSKSISFCAIMKTKYAIIEAKNKEEAEKILQHTPFISRQWETIMVENYSNTLKEEFKEYEDITEGVNRYLLQFPMAV